MQYVFNPFTNNFDAVGTNGGGSGPILTITGNDDNSVTPNGSGNVNIFALQSPVNNDAGITAKRNGSTVHELDILLTNRMTFSATTTGNTPEELVVFDLAANTGSLPGVFNIEVQLMAFDITDNSGASYTFNSGVLTSGTSSSFIGEANSVGYNFYSSPFGSSPYPYAVTIDNGANTDYLVTITGFAGKTIDWNAILTYRFVS